MLFTGPFELFEVMFDDNETTSSANVTKIQEGISEMKTITLTMNGKFGFPGHSARLHRQKWIKAGCTTIGAPKHLYKRRRYGPTDRRTDGLTDGRTDPLIEVLRST